MNAIRRLIASCLILAVVLAGRVEAGGEVTAEAVRDALPRLESLVEQTLEQTGVPGVAIAVVHRDEVVYLKGFGVRQAGTETPVDENTVFQLASVSKPMASTVIATLVGRGTVDWDDRIAELDPTFALFDAYAGREVTIRDMLCHRSGLPDHAGDWLEDLGYDREQILHRLRFFKPTGRFRADYAYTNFGYTAAAVAAAKSAGSPWEELCAETLYQPLDMRSTSSRHADFLAAENRAHLHVKIDGRWVARYDRQPDTESPAGGVSSSVRDMAQWMRLQLGRGTFEGREIVAAAALDETHRPQIASRPAGNPATDRTGHYGLGWNVGTDDEGATRWSHSGAFNLGAATVVSLLPAEQLGIVVLTNAQPRGVPEALAESFFDLVRHDAVRRDWVAFFNPLFQAAMRPDYGTETDYSQTPAKVAPPLPNESYSGTYGSRLWGNLEISERDGSLILRLGPERTPFPLRHWNRDVFLYQPAGESAAGLAAVTFTVDQNQNAGSVVLENLNATGQGTFLKISSEE